MLINLISSNSIFETEGNDVLTEEGYKVIRCDSILNYNKKNCHEELLEKIPEGKVFFDEALGLEPSCGDENSGLTLNLLDVLAKANIR